MDNLKEALENRIDALFSDTSSELYNEAYRLASSVSRNYSDNPLENLKERVIEGEQIIKTIGEGLVDFCNKKLSEFEKEISGIQEPTNQRLRINTEIY